ncbi:LPXTG cell wall anchor domain-containing protein [Streptococcus suis]|uniref:LPXTG cell wall anchor domain-containing protein n=1 Tax=Streptococcus suis TaxID=1307 RepID=UPI000CF5A23E|nr:LPXTG cell wall anchor domain-containing protein [Streptococcus suis]
MKKKNYVVGTLVAGTAITLATVGASTVAADTDQVVNIETGGVTTVENATQVPVESSSTSETAVTATDVQTADEAVEQAQSAVDTQKGVVESATQAYGTAEEIATQTKEQLTVAEQTAAQATPEAIQEAEAAIDQVKAEQVTKETTIQSATESVKQAQADVVAQEKVVEAAKQSTSKEQADVDAAKDKINEAEAAFDSATLLQAQQEAGRLDAKVKEEQKTVSDLKSNLASKEQEEADLIANGSKIRTELEQTVTTAGPEYYTEVVERELATHQVSESDAVSTPKDPTYIGNDGKTYYVVANENVLFDGEKVETIVLPNKEAFYQRKTIDYRKVAEYFREYLVELRRINGIDIPVPEVTESALKWAKARTEEMAKNDVLSHATDLKPEEFGLSGEIENASWGSLPGESTLDEKEIAYNEILGYFNDYTNVNNYGTKTPDTVNWMNYGHRNTMLAASGTGFAIDATKGYGILTFVSTDGTGIYDEMPSNLDPSTQRSYEFMGEIRYYYPSLAQDLGRAENKDSDPLRSEYYFNGKRIKFLPKTTFRYIWEETLYQKNTNRDEAVATLTNFNATQKAAEQAIASAISTVKTDLATAQNQLSTDEKALKLANDRVAVLTTDNAVKVQALKVAQSELALQQSELKAAKDSQVQEEEKLSKLEAALTQSQEKLKQAQLDLEEAKKAVMDAGQTLVDLQTAQEKLEKAQALFSDANQNLLDAKANLELELEVLANLQTDLDSKQLYYQELKAKFEAAQVILRDLEEKAKDNVIVTLPDGTVIAIPKDGLLTHEKPAIDIAVVKDAIAKGQDVTIVDGKAVVDDKKAKTVVTTATKSQTIQSNKQISTIKKAALTSSETVPTLPKTGSEGSILLTSIGSVLGGLGLAGFRKRKQG